ncbi:MAG: hypothetical protein AAB870_01730 [Patescibacteria group bacterium]
MEQDIKEIKQILTTVAAKIIDIDERLKTDYATKNELKEVEDRIVAHAVV